MNTRPFQLILLTLTAFSAAAQPAPRPTPLPTERAAEFIQRWDDWLATIPQEDRAWNELQAINTLIYEQTYDFGGITDDPTEADRWKSTATFIKDHPQLLQRIRTNAARPHLAMPITDASLPDDPDLQPTAFDIQLPQLSMIRIQSKLLIADMILAIENEDTQRAVLDARALANLCRYIPQTNTIIEYLVSLATTNLLYYPILIDLIDLEIFTDAQLEELDQLIHKSTSHMSINDAGEMEHFTLLDMIHWYYEGNTNGRITQKGAKRLIDTIELASFIDEDGLFHDSGIDEPAKLMKALKITPKLALLDEQLVYASAYYEAIYEDFQAPLHTLKAYSSSTIINTTISNTTDSMKFLPCVVMGFDPAKVFQYRIHNNTQLHAARLLLAAHRHKITHGSFPQSLEDFDPTFLTFTPTDLFTGQPLHYDLINDQPRIYSNGTDRDDDSATPAESHDFIPLDKLNEILNSNPASIDGDWIIYPPQ